MKKRVYWIVGFIFLAIISFIFDSEIVRFFSSLRNVYLNDLFFGVTFISSGIIIFFLLTSLFLWKEHKRRWVFPLWLTLFISVVVSFIIKFLIKRLRPFQQGIVSTPEIILNTGYSVWNFSLPSFHAMLGFCAIPLLSKEFRKTKIIWIFFACLIGLSRVYFGIHFLSDVIIGGVLGYLIGIFIIKLEIKKKFGEKIYRKIKK